MKVYLLILLGVFVSCKSNSKAEPTENLASDTTVPEMENDSTKMVRTVKEFLGWYKSNYNKANDFGFTFQDPQGNYMVNLDECQKYLNFLKSSGHISEIYEKEWKKYFESKAQYLKENLQNEGPPEGFEFDLVLITQEPEIILNKIDALQYVVTNNEEGTTVVRIEGELGYDFEMNLENGIWKIDYIATMNYD
ncbi:MAG: hypothetical protein IPH93_12605 [Saprospiraceae bacterium]|nr:hypothetical protein [Saprospiraceae bacterium]MBK7812783.1 hypothetical protein [Saprospiraceae bacterium]MBK9630973.1 hypothetical protein [Saprospiraceae bacterium]